jgi:hypothetical protein
MAKYGPFNYERTLGSRNYNFSATVEGFVTETEKRMRALAMQSTQDLIEEVQTPVGKGGKMRVDTGFLRASGQMSLTGIPSGPVRGDPDKKYAWNNATAIADFAGFTLGQTIYFGWTANYAKYREAYDGFLISGIQNWQTIVNRVAAQIIARSPANRGSK